MKSGQKTLVAAISAGAVAILPTETVYGLVTSAFSIEGIRAIYKLKGRLWKKPLALMVHELKAAAPFLESIPPEAEALAEHFCPGPLTLVFKASLLGQMLMGGTQTVGVRIPDHQDTLKLLRKIAVPLASTSANPSGKPDAVSVTQAKRYFGAKVKWIIDGGACRVKTPSSVVDFSHYPFTITRESAIAKKDLEKILFR